MEDDGLTKSRMVIYSLPSIAREPIFTFLGVYAVVFYESLGASIAILGFFIAISRGFDILNDPIIAHLTDNTKTKIGRRYPWILGGFIVYAIVIVGFWSPPETDGLEAWFAVFYIAIFLLYSIVFIPYTAMAPELTQSQEKRQRLYAIQAFTEGLGYFVLSFFPGLIVAVVSTVMDWQSDGCRVDASQVGFALMGVVIACWLVFSVILMVCKIKPSETVTNQTTLEDGLSTGEFVPSVLKLQKNYPFMWLLPAWLWDRIAANLLITFIPFLVIYVLDPKGNCEDNGTDTDEIQCNPLLWVSIVFASFILGSLISTPIWHKLATRYGKRQLWLWWAFATCITYFVAIFIFKGANEYMIFVGICNGIPYGGRFLSETMLADIIEYEELLTARRAEGVFTMFQQFVPKIVGIPAQVLPLAILVAIGFEPTDDNEPQDQSLVVRLYIRFVFAVCPLILTCVSWWVRYKFPFRNNTQIDAIVVQVKKRRAGEELIVDPITNHLLVNCPEVKDEFKIDYEVAEYFQSVTAIDRILEGGYQGLRKRNTCLLITWIVVVIVLITIAGATFQLLYEDAFVWIPILAVVLLGLSSLFILFYYKRVVFLNKYTDHKFNAEFLGQLKDYYNCLTENYKKIGNKKHVQKVFDESFGTQMAEGAIGQTAKEGERVSTDQDQELGPGQDQGYAQPDAKLRS